MEPAVVIYGFESSNNMKVRVACRYKSIPYTFETIDPSDRSEIERLSGQPLTPLLLHGDRVLFDSAAILRYLDANFSGTKRLFDGNRETMYEIESWEAFARRELAAPLLSVIRKRHAGTEQPTTVEEASRRFASVTESLEQRLGGRQWLVDDRLTAADVTAAPVVFRSLSGGFVDSPPGREQMLEWTERVMALDAPETG